MQMKAATLDVENHYIDRLIPMSYTVHSIFMAASFIMNVHYKECRGYLKAQVLSAAILALKN